MDKIPKIYTTQEVANILKISDQTVAWHLKNGSMRGFKVGNRWRVKAGDLEKFIEEGTNNGS